MNGVADALERVSRALDELPDDLATYLVPAAGTYNCRKVAGSRAPSMHAYGAAIDIDTRYADYWRWSPGEHAALAQPHSRCDRADLRDSTASSGAAPGITTTPCTSNTGRSCCA